MPWIIFFLIIPSSHPCVYKNWCMSSNIWTTKYHISGNFCNYLIFAFFETSFQLQNIEYKEIISCIIFSRTLLKLQKLTDKKLGMLHTRIFPMHFRKFCDTRKILNIRYEIMNKTCTGVRPILTIEIPFLTSALFCHFSNMILYVDR